MGKKLTNRIIKGKFQILKLLFIMKCIYIFPFSNEAKKLCLKYIIRTDHDRLILPKRGFN